ncbi:MAG: hypothetical protein NZ928_02400 [Endomicrobia bacterium]|nr:hypothetical protein [Endomicrobiia bacterium]MCX7941212.1 hypothetical protein [Endomicrobiia bacterium]MDW8056094.1 hypothetical protein [Elusimicrobiota bacterium]
MKKFIPLAVFSIAMGFLEATVVVYLRELYYPTGFGFPLNTFIPARILNIELVREITTIVMLICVGILSGGRFIWKLCYFLFSFGVWDIFYYVGLKVFINWPESLFSWDLLFLIPVAWVGPVIAPVICSATMIFLAMVVIYCEEKLSMKLNWSLIEWSLVLVGSFLIYLTFTWDFTTMIIEKGFICKFLSLGSDAEFAKVVSSYVPTKFLWPMFVLGEVLILLSLFLVCIKSKRL